MKQTVGAMARRSEVDVGSRYEVGPFTVEVGRRKLWNGSQLVQLSPKAFDLLVLLVAERHRVVDKDELVRRLWPDTVVGEESVTQSISALRRALGDDPANPEYIATVPRRGYQFIGPVSGSGVASPPGVTAWPVPREQPATPAVNPVEPAAAPLRPPVRWPVMAALVLATATLTALATWFVREPASVAPPLRFTQEAPPGTSIASGGALSPDGRALAFVARDQASGTTSLWVRELNSTTARRLAGTEGATRPFWAPNNGALAFFSQGALRTISLADGTVRTLASIGPLPLGGTWSSRNTILFGNRRSGLAAVFLDTGQQRTITTLDRNRGETGHRHPQFLPDGDRFLYFISSTDPEHAGTYVGSVSGAVPRRRLLPGTAEGVVYAHPGFLLYVTDGQLMARRFDATALEPEAPPVTLAAGVEAPLVTNATTISASGTGLVAYGGGAPRVRLIWHDANGNRIGGVEGPVDLHNPVITPDNALVLASQVWSSRRGVWAIDTRGGESRLVTDGTRAFPSPDGRQVAFSTDASGVLDLHVRDIDATHAAALVVSPYAKTVSHWTGDGRYIVFVSSDPKTLEDIWLLQLDGDRKPRPFLQTQYNELQGEVSPDGRWLAYTSDESGTWEVYVQRFPSGGAKRAVSVNGGFEPHWQRSGAGNRLFYIGSNRAIMSVELSGDDVGQPRQLFQVALAHDEPTLFRNLYAVTADGRRFLIDSNDGPGAPLTVLVNWPALAGHR